MNPYVRNLLAIAIYAVIGLVAVQTAERLSLWPGTGLARLFSTAAAVLIAVRLRAAASTYILVAILAFTVAEFAVHAIFGLRVVQGGPAHLAVLIGAAAGVASGWLLPRLVAVDRSVGAA